MPSVVIRVDPERRAWWKETLQQQLPGYHVYLWDEDQYEKKSIDYAVVWMPPLGGLSSLPNLRCVFSVGAGSAHILRDPAYPRAVPIVRCVNEDLRKRMTEYILLQVLRFHRRLPEIQAAQAAKSWRQYVEPLARDVSVGLLGLGNLGAAAAAALLNVGYTVQGWSRRGRPVKGVKVFSGDAGLLKLLSSSDILVCMLPGTSATENLLNGSRLAAMKGGSYLINVGRGETIVDNALMEHIRNGHIRGATLDVFRSEPLPEDDPYWSEPKVLITTHTASVIDPATGGKTISNNILAFDAGQTLKDIVDLEQGY